MEKNEIRKKIRDLKSMLLEKERQSAADDVFRRVENTAAFMVAERILMYHSLPDELSTRAFLTKWSNRKRFYLPRVNGVNLEILPYDETRLELGAFHIEEPTGNDVVNPDDIDLIIVPGVAYDNRGNRVGRGKGFYDRLLRSMRAIKIGIGYEFQIVNEIQAESHDVKMDLVISPSSCVVVNPAVK